MFMGMSAACWLCPPCTAQRCGDIVLRHGARVRSQCAGRGEDVRRVRLRGPSSALRDEGHVSSLAPHWSVAVSGTVSQDAADAAALRLARSLHSSPRLMIVSCHLLHSSVVRRTMVSFTSVLAVSQLTRCIGFVVSAVSLLCLSCLPSSSGQLGVLLAAASLAGEPVVLHRERGQHVSVRVGAAVCGRRGSDGRHGSVHGGVQRVRQQPAMALPQQPAAAVA